MNDALQHIHDSIKILENRFNNHIIGQEDLIQKLILTVFTGGHALIEWKPWLWKTKVIRTLAKFFDTESKRISFTSDLLPSDIIGAEIFRPNSGNFEVRKGPLFTNFLLADEINRTPPKVQSALLEAMEEKQITIGNETFFLPSPFFVFATQNPLENEGTYPLPEAQLDRFFIKIYLDFPNQESEKKILQEMFPPKNEWEIIFSWEEIIEIQKFIAKSVHADEKIIDYTSRILSAYRKLCEQDFLFHSGDALLSYGPSTRAGIFLIRGAKVLAVMNGRDFVLPEDIKNLVPSVINHRIGLSYHAMSENFSKNAITEKILDSVEIVKI